MLSSRYLAVFAAILALGVATAEKRGNLRKLRRERIHSDSKLNAGLEEDVVFWNNMARRMQDMSVPDGGDGSGPGETTDPPVPAPVTPMPTEVGTEVGTDPSTLPEVTPSPTPAGGDTPAPTPAQGGSFECPQASFVGCTAVDPTDPQDECTNVGQPCPGSVAGEFCCVDACPRNYCTAKPALLAQAEFEAKLQAELMMMSMSTEETISKSNTDDGFEAPMQTDEDWSHLLDP